MNEKIKYVEREDSILIKIDAESIEMMNYYPIKNVVMEAAEKFDKDIIVDMFDIVYVDSAFLSVFVEAYKVLHKKRKSIYLKDTQKHVLDIIHTLNLENILIPMRD